MSAMTDTERGLWQEAVETLRAEVKELKMMNGRLRDVVISAANLLENGRSKEQVIGLLRSYLR